MTPESARRALMKKPSRQTRIERVASTLIRIRGKRRRQEFLARLDAQYPKKFMGEVRSRARVLWEEQHGSR